MTALVTDSGRKTPARLAGSAILAVQSDDRLVKLVRSGHERAFEAIVERYRKPLVRFCGRILPESRCEDAVQQAFINAHAALTGSDEPLQLKPWLFTITRNAALNMLRQNGWHYDEIPLDFDGVRRPDQVVEQRIELQQTVAAVNELPDRQRNALVMRELEGRSYQEIALALGANDGAVRQLLNRARVTLRSAASAFIPPPLVARAASSLTPGDGRSIELLGGAGAAGIAKVGATALVGATLVVGAVNAPLPLSTGHKPTREKATLAADRGASASNTRDRMIAAGPAASDPAPAVTGPIGARPHGSNHSSRSGSSHRGAGHGEGRRSADDGRSSGDSTRERSGSGGSDDSTRTRSGSGDDSSRTTSGSDDHSGTSGTSGSSGSDDIVASVPTSDGSGSTSGTSGESTTSGTSGSSGSDDSLTSTSGSSGSGSSGSSDTTTTTTTTTTSGSSGSGDTTSTLDH